MTCRNCGKDTAQRLITIRQNADYYFSRGEIAKAQTWRWKACSGSSDCGLACCNLDKEAGKVADCVDPDTGSYLASNLYEALKRPEFKCPRGLF